MHIFHKWDEVKQSVVFSFKVCSICGKRKMVQIRPYMFPEPMQSRWLNGGEFYSRDEIAIMFPNHPKVKEYMFSKLA